MKLHKKFGLCLFAAAAVLLCLLALPQTAHAASESDYVVPDCEETASGTCGEKLAWTLYEDGTLHISGSGAMSNNFITTVPWYDYRESIVRIVIDVGCTAIGGYAFSFCTNLVDVAIPEGVTKIGYDAFYECDALASITIPNSVTSIGESAFSGCDALTSITIPDSVTSIGNSAFSCDSLTGIWVDEKNAYYSSDSYGVLFNKDQTELIRAPGKLSGSYGIPDSVTSIGESAFGGCDDLTSITIPDSVTSIGDGAFANCTGLEKIIIPDGITSIGDSLFWYCTSLTSIAIPNGVTSIGKSAFGGCDSLTSITIPGSVTRIYDWVFANCTSLICVTYCGTQEQWDAIAVGEHNEPLTNATLQLHNFEGSNCTLCGTNGVIASGTCGENLTWEMYFNGTLRILGSGAMNNGTVTTVPWYDYRESIVRVVIDEGCTSIGNFAFIRCTNLADVTIPEGVTTICKYAFSDCEGLASIDLPDTLTSIGECAFSSCGGLTSITIPNSVTSIGVSAFEYCRGLTSITIPSSITTIGKNAFSHSTGAVDLYIADIASWCNISFENYLANPIRYAKNLFINGELVTDLTIPRSVTKIGAYAFYNFTGLTSITVSDSLTSIANYAFDGCNIKKLIIAEGSKEITKTMVMCKYTLEEVVIPDSVTSIGDYAFDDCDSLTSINIPSGVTSIGRWAFDLCYALDDVYITDASAWCKINFSNDQANPMMYAEHLHIMDAAGNEITEIVLDDTVTAIPNRAFYNCTSLTDITIPDSVTSIGEYAFSGCTNLTELNVAEGNTKYRSSGNCIIVISSKSLIAGCSASQIPSDGSVTSIGYGAFRDCTGLTSITIPDSVTIICPYAFYECDGLTSITIPDSVTSIDDWAFYECDGLTSITISDSVTHIGDYAFCYCDGLEKTIYCGTQEQWDAIEMGKNNNPLINALQFHDYENCICTTCGADAHIWSEATCTAPKTCSTCGATEGSALGHAMQLSEAEIPADCENAGKTAVYVCANGCGHTEGGEEIPALGHSFENDTCTICQHYNGPLTFVLNEAGDGYIVSGCDESASGELVIPATYNGLPVTGIGNGAFYFRYNLTSITIPNSVTSIGISAFSDCSSLSSITIPDSVTSIGNVAFENCKSLTSIVIPDGVSVISSSMFYNCESLSSITLPDSVTSIEQRAFAYCDNLTNITLPDSVTSIGDAVFYHCVGMESIIIPDGIASIGVDVFNNCRSLTDVTIPNSVASISKWAFYNCSSLASVTYCGTQTQWNAIEKGDFNAPLTDATLQLHNYENGVCNICGQKEFAAGDIDGNDEVTYDDAVYLLLHSMFGEEMYPLNGADGDIDCNGIVDGEDAVYLLLHTLFGDMFYPLNTPALPSSKEELIG